MQDFKINQLKTFIAIVEHNGFHAAANILHKSQPAVSLSIKTLENNLEQQLFEKGKHAKMTEFGQYFLKYAKSLLKHHDEIKTRLEKGVNTDNLTVTIAVLPSVAQHLMPKFLKGFLAENPNARINLRDTGSTRIQKLIKERKVDIGICTLTNVSSEFSVKQIVQDRFGLVCHRNHPITQLKKVSWKIVAEYAPIANGTWSILPLREREALIPAAVMTITSMNSLNATLEAGLGVTVLPEFAFAEETELVFMPLSMPTIYRQIFVIKDNNKELSPVAEHFFEYLVSFKS
ncbi:MAG: LysR family transcriptional regulator [Ostreibacterium sp.]